MHERPSKIRRYSAGTAYVLNILCVAWLGLCTLAGFVSPLEAKYLALFSITSPFAIIANALFAAFWLIGRHKVRTLLSILALCACYRLVIAVVGIHPGTNKGTTADLKVMSWNVHGLGMFDRPRKPDTDDSMIALIRRESPDLLVMPEYYTVYNNALKPYTTLLLDTCGFKEFRFKYDNQLGLKIYLGIAIFSKYPLTDYKVNVLHIDSKGNEDVVIVQADVHLPNDKTVRLFATHLQSFTLSDGEKTYLEEVKHRDKDITIKRSTSFMKRFGEAYLKRAVQADSAAHIIAQSPYPVILCGDFNDLPGSYTYSRMKGPLCDAFVEGGFGFGRTYNMFSPTLRIDYILHDGKAMNLVNYHSPKTKLSDHNPVIAALRVN